jgi:APA family basic amino acid/polyamine antiporter
MQKETVTLVRGLGLVAAVSIIIGNVIGTGVFFKARVMTCNVGEPTWVMLAWVAAGLLSLAGALTYAELAAMKPEAGGEYIYLRDSYGRFSSFLYGWMMMLISKPGAQAAVAVAFSIALNKFLDGALEKTLFSTDIFSFGYELTSLQIVAVMMIVIFTTINCLSVSLGGAIATALTAVKIALIAFVGVGAFVWVTGGTFDNFALVEAGGACEGVAGIERYGSAGYSFAAGFGAAMLGALWGYDGWNNLTLVAGEVKNPGRNIPLALIGGMLVIIGCYLFANLAYFYVLDPTAIADVSKSSPVAGEVIGMFFGGGAANVATGFAVALFTVGLMLSSMGTLHTSILTGARVPYAMAKDGLMFKPLGMLSEETRVPVMSLFVQGAWACVLALSGSFDALTDYVIFGSWIFYALATSSVFVFRRRYPDAERPYRAFGYPVVPAIFLVVAGWLLFNTVMTATTQALIGIVLILLGVPVYLYLNRASKGD